MGTGDRVSPFVPSTHIVVDELLVRPFVRDDARELMEAVTESVEHLRPWMPWIAYEPQDVHDKRKLIKEFSEEWDTRTGFPMGIFIGNRLVGASGFHVCGPADSFEIGYWVRVGETTKGIATRVAKALVNEAFRHPEVSRVFINHDQANVRSGLVPARLGFSIDHTEVREPTCPGESGVHVSWVVTRDAWTFNS